MALSIDLVLLLLLLVSLAKASYSRTLKEELSSIMTYHNGAILKDDIPLTIYWCGKFTQKEKSILTGFLSSFTPNGISTNPQPFGSVPSVAQWWDTINQAYVSKAINNARTNIYIDKEISDNKCSSGKILSLADLSQLATKAAPKEGGVAVIYTSASTLVQGFGMSRCGVHNFDSTTGAAWIWVGNPATQCLGQCAWPFAKPVYGPQTEPLKSPNGNAAIDGMVITTATLMANTVTNPDGYGFYKGDMKVEAGTACSGVFGRGAYTGFPGKVLNDSKTGRSYNVQGSNRKKYLLPAVFDTKTSSCKTLV